MVKEFLIMLKKFKEYGQRMSKNKIKYGRKITYGQRILDHLKLLLQKERFKIYVTKKRHKIIDNRR